MLHTLERGACQGHPQGPRGNVQGCTASHTWLVSSILPVPSERRAQIFQVSTMVMCKEDAVICTHDRLPT